MLFSLKDIQNYPLKAQDGEFGSVKTLIIDDFEWVVRYLVAEVGSRDVLLSIDSLGIPDIENQVLPVQHTKEQIMNSPEIDIDQPIAREMERQLFDYYQWPYYWDRNDVPNTMPGDLTAVPLIEMELDREDQELIPQTGGQGSTSVNERLRSLDQLTGYTIHTTNDDRNAGKLSDIVVQAEDWNVMYLVLDTGGMLSDKKVLIAPSWVQQIDARDKRIDVDLREESIDNSPDQDD